MNAAKIRKATEIAAHGGALKPVYKTLGISRKTLYEKMQKYGLDKKMLKSSHAGDEDESGSIVDFS